MPWVLIWPTINDYALGLVNQILNGTDEEFAKMSYSQLLNLRDVAYPQLPQLQLQPAR